MSITRTVYNTEELLGVYRDLEPIQEFWLSFFPGVHNSITERIEWSKITNYRHLAPLVLPTQQGRPTFRAEENMTSVKPGYLKPKDAVQDAAMLTRRAGLGELGQARPLSPAERYMATVAAVLQKHRSDIERRWEWMAAQAVLYGSITLVDDGYPTATVDFQRAADHSITLGAGNRWGDTDVNAVDDLDEWNDRMADVKFGGPATDVIMGTAAWKVFKDDAQVLKLLNMDIRNTSGTSLDLGMGNGDKVQFKGNISRNLRVWVYSDYYEAPDGTVMPYMDPRDVLMIGQNVQGVKAFGAILDKKANFQPLAIFPKMWDEEDPSATILMTQSAPLMVPINPNNTLRARVLA
jgi:hypothetical protein